ncbi:MAG: 2-hydroxychromene-2-carboxylate isomerase [Granulosicoccus sp.]|nr:2-hydroxychromene-2-carboxylate isomerase [Granulosicoccus sp.]
MENQTLHYYLSLQSPWTYLGHERLCAIARKHEFKISIFPVDYGVIFPATGGLPLPKRAPERRAYRLLELKRWRTALELPLNLEPRFFPADDKLAMRLVVAVRREDPEAAVELAGRILRAVWAEERDIADESCLKDILSEQGLDAENLFATALENSTVERIVKDTDLAITKGVFGAPTYIVGTEVFWGQDRLDFLERQLVNLTATA